MTGRDDPIGKVCVGVIAGAFGIRGEVRLKSFCAEPEAIADYAPLTDAAGREYSLVIDRPVKGGFAARLGGVPTREAAEALKGVRLFVPRDRLPSLPSDEFYHADLIGLPVADGGGRKLGQVRAVHDFGAGDMLEITGPGLSQPVMLPFTIDTVPIVDLAAHRIVADPPAGLFPDDGAEDDAAGGETDAEPGAQAGDDIAARKDEA
ncbi:16S rRNA processing protein RimM [Albimonas donghaensis]|uniref:Ribosome maturation factor RimM n=1 Tax=Albimonas donghaensis TaxID=356660 RepID=A0A1H3FXB4_9RHOB|nr:16S rRNA processing protein RimM [Albimonas donghaensis]